MDSQSPDNGCAELGPVPCAMTLMPAANWALFLDVDGTLLKFADTPDGVAPRDRVCRLLERVGSALGGALALVSGRTIASLDALFAPLHLPAAGLHGLERRDAGGRMHVLAEADSLDHLRPRLLRLVESLDGLLLEDKGPALAVHYRRVPGHAEAIRRQVDRLVAPSNRELRVIHGKMVSEIKPRQADKGTAIRAFMTEVPYAGCRPVFVGDDVTDEDGFAAVNRLNGLAIHVGDGTRTLARYRLPDVDAVIAWLDMVQSKLHSKDERQSLE